MTPQRSGQPGQCPPPPPKTQTPTRTKTPSHNSNVSITRYRAFPRWGGQCPPGHLFSDSGATAPPGRVIPPIAALLSICRHAARARLGDTGRRLRLGHQDDHRPGRSDAVRASSRPESVPLGIAPGITTPSEARFSSLGQRKQCPLRWDQWSHLLPHRRFFQSNLTRITLRQPPITFRRNT
jgi:hypothetical protein